MRYTEKTNNVYFDCDDDDDDSLPDKKLNNIAATS